jgi:hypothetical protein
VRSESGDWRSISIRGQAFSRIEKLLDSSKVPGPYEKITTTQLLSYSHELFEWYDRCQTFVLDLTSSIPEGYFKMLLSCGREFVSELGWKRNARAIRSFREIAVFNHRSLEDEQRPDSTDQAPKDLFLPSEAFEGASAALVASRSHGIIFEAHVPNSPSFRSIFEQTGVGIYLLTGQVISSGNTESVTPLTMGHRHNNHALTTAGFRSLHEMYSVLAPLYSSNDLPPPEHRMKLCHFMTEAGPRFGWVTSQARVGDELCYFAGAPFPFIVRQVIGTDSRTLVGSAWLHDVP